MKSHAARLRAALTAMLAVSVCTVAAEAAPPQPGKNIVLVHGAFADGSSWAKVIPILASFVGRSDAKCFTTASVGRLMKPCLSTIGAANAGGGRVVAATQGRSP